METPEAVIEFWFVQHGSPDWWGAKPEFDREIRERFADTHTRVALGEGFSWRENAAGRVAEIIVLDQFSRQLHRGEGRAFAQDGMALVLAQEAVAGGFDDALGLDQRMFLYMPFMHSESLAVHEAAQPRFEAIGGDAAKSAADHLACIRRFGRYPKRNSSLGRASTAEELAYIAEIGDRMF
jgi:uncharacterized protein (DUF924 family)